MGTVDITVPDGRQRMADDPSTGPTGGTATAMLFQDSALFPWLTVAANVELPLRLRGVGKAERRAVADDLLERVHLAGFGPKRPHELSGGMRQRAALARALAQDAGLLLMDEPFGALDAITRDLLHDELESLWMDRGFTVLFVTHNVREAARLGDRIVLLTSRPGRVAATFTVDLARPRRIDSPEIAGLAATVTDQLRAEVGAMAVERTDDRRSRLPTRRRWSDPTTATPTSPSLDQALAGLDALERPDARPGATACPSVCGGRPGPS